MYRENKRLYTKSELSNAHVYETDSTTATPMNIRQDKSTFQGTSQISTSRNAPRELTQTGVASAYASKANTSLGRKEKVSLPSIYTETSPLKARSQFKRQQEIFLASSNVKAQQSHISQLQQPLFH